MKPLLDPPPSPVSRRIRGAALLAAGYLAGVHLALAEDRYKQDAHYVGALFVAAALVITIGASVAAAGRKFGLPAMWTAWVIDGLIALGMGVTFLLSRTVGLPDYHRHDWPVIQVIALPVEAGYLLLFFLAGRSGLSREGRAGAA